LRAVEAAEEEEEEEEEGEEEEKDLISSISNSLCRTVYITTRTQSM
jgi:hypothetical protein